MRRTPSLISAAVLVALAAATLTGCAASGNDSNCLVSSGPASDSVSATGDFGAAALDVKVPSPLTATTTERTTLIAGTGAPLQAGQYAKLDLHIYDGGTGKLIAAPSTWTSDSVSVLRSQGLTDALRCVPEGSRVAIVIPAAEGASTLGAAADSTAIIVADLSNYLLTRARGTKATLPAGFPAVTLAPNGQPGIVIPSDTPAPTTIESADSIAGHGAVLTSKDTVVVHYSTITWNTPTVTSTSWNQNAPVTIGLTGTDGLTKAIVGQRIGSQVVVLVPAADNSGTSVVFIIDLLGVKS
ncbi:hypothetical protein [Gryllotalpicola sp.]|uniref:FKBP-type peptidyl-prolyl cis-trans isomerase n=1 Tax=Gryllotalpicola sp. TaxID=1932787 RepID=UPI0026245692|nr:hypothetical protein [Gryllotalpicola sp.]